MSGPVLALPQNLDLAAASKLRDELVARRGADLTIDAGEVQRLGAVCLQVLVAAKRDWEAAGHAASFNTRSKEFEEAVTLMGAGPLLGFAQTEI